MQKLLFFIVFIITITGKSQVLPDYSVKELEPAEFIVTYSLRYQEDSLPPHFTRQEDQILFIGKNVSMYLSRNAYNFEKNMRKFKSVAELQEYLFTKPSMPHNLIRLYKNQPKGKLTFADWVSPNTFKFEESLNLFNWKLNGDTATILGYKAQKATCDFGGRSWEAWFCREIPYSDGPYKFNGLPGLILNLHDTRNHYVFEFISIEKPKDEVMIEYLEDDYLESTKQDYFKALDAFNANLATWARDNGGGIDAQQNAARIAIERNNPIELIRK